VDTTDEEVTAISLFSGYGGLDHGIRRVIPNLRVVAYVEIEAYADALLATKIQDGSMDEGAIYTDVTQFPSERFRDKVHLVIAGYPCQDFSCAGKRAGLEGNRGKMWGHTRSIINGVNARAFFGENVEGHLSLGFDTVVSDLAEDGFMVKGGLYSAFEVGAPHLRKRIFSLSFRSDPRLAPWDKFKPGNQGWLDLDHAKFQALTTGKVELADPPGFGHEWSGRPDEGGSPTPTEGCGDGDGGRLGNAEHDGLSSEQELRSNEAPSNDGREEEPETSGEFEGTDRPTDVPSLQGRERRGYSTIEGVIRQNTGNPELGNAEHDGLQVGCSEGGGQDRGGEEGRMLESPRASTGSRALADNTSDGYGRSKKPSRSNEHRVSSEEGEVGRDIRREAGGGSAGDGKLAHSNSDGLHGEGEPGGLGDKATKETEGGSEPPQAPKNCGEEGADYSLALAKLYDDGFPGAKLEGGDPTVNPGAVIRWPARPGRPQHWWEQPRTIDVGDSENTRRQRPNDEHEEAGAGEGEHPVRSGGGTSEGEEAKPLVGGKPDAVTRGLHPNRIDRLRMLGNGVVWLTASKAFSELLTLHKEDVAYLDKLGKLPKA
jgi:DNA (cytosine-5)-methyltransferase 1